MTGGGAAASPWEGHRAGSPGYRRIVVAMVAAGIATFAQLYSVQPVLYGVAATFGSDAAGAALTVSMATGGLAGFVVVWSGAADRYGRTRAMTVSMVGSTVVGLAAPFAPDLAALIAIRTVHGFLLGGVPAVAVAYLAEEIHPDFLLRVTGLHIAGNSIGGMAGRLVTGAVAEFGGWRWGIAANSLVCAVAVVVFVVALPQSRGSPRRHGGRGGPGVARRLLISLSDPGLVALYAQAFFLMGAFVTVYNYLGFRLLAPPFEVSQLVVSALFVSYLAGTAGSAAVGRAPRSWSRRRLLLSGVAGMVAGAVALLSGSLVVVVAGLLLYTAAFFSAHTTASAWVGRRATTARAQAATCYTLAYYLGSSLFGWLGGLVFLAADWTAVISYVVVLCVAAVLASTALRGR